MRFYADLHVHSKYSRATSRDLDLEHLAMWGKRKGLTVIATGDFTHPAWWDTLRDELIPAEPGLFRLEPEVERAIDAELPVSCRRPVRFLLEVEISTIYKKGDKTRKVHHLIYAANFDTAGRFRDRLDAIGNIASDGRPILGLDSRHLLEITLESGDDAFLIPAHIWTPWFSAMGSKSGFDSVDECYGDLAGHLFAVETGLSSDPPMNWRVSHLDRFTLVSSSDAHSPAKLGREANVFETELDYFAMRRALETGDGWGGTVEFFPEEGKYHLDGHRACGVRFEPDDTRRHAGRCPSCGKPLTVGVLHRVEALADRPSKYSPDSTAPFRSLVPLPEVIGELRGFGPQSKAVRGVVAALTARLGPELDVLEQMPLEDVERGSDPMVAEAIRRLRDGKVRAEGGFDGEYGTIRVFDPEEIVPQLTLAPLFGADFVATPPSRPKWAEAPTPDEPDITGGVAASEPDLEAGPDALPDDRPILDRLDPDQRGAAEITHGPLLIVAGPGSGKTRTLVHRLAYLVETGVDPATCLAITFTRRAAGELRERLDALLGDAAGAMTVTTFHGLGLDLLRRHAAAAGLPDDFRIADDAVRRELVAERFGLSPSEAGRAVRRLSAVRRPSVDGSSETGADLPVSLDAYRDALGADGFVDLDDLLCRPAELFDQQPELAEVERQRVVHVSVDEYQDVDAVQYRLLRHLVRPDGNLCAIGDPDQSIYRFRGADVGFFLRFRQDFPGAEVVELGRNYRSSATIVDAAAAVIRPSSLVPDRAFVPNDRSANRRIVLHEAATEAAEAEFVTHSIEQLVGGTSYFSFDSGRVDDRLAPTRELGFDEIAILIRTRAQAPALLEALDRAGLPVQHRTHARLAEHDGVRRLLQRLTLRLDAPAAGDDELPALLEGLAEGEEEQAALDLLAPLASRYAAQPRRFLAAVALGAEVDTWDPRAERLSLLTLHAAKGLEFPVVFVVGCDDGILPMRWAFETRGETLDADALAEERRLVFVGMTRAKEHLVLSRARSRSWRGERRDTRPSPFLVDLPVELVERQDAPGRHRARRRPEPKQLSLL